MKYGSQSHLDYIKRRLQQKCRTRLPVSVEYVNDLGRVVRELFPHWKIHKGRRLGVTINFPGHISIMIENHLDFEMKAQTLTHEWAHATTPPEAPHHGVRWARNYAKTYKCVYLRGKNK